MHRFCRRPRDFVTIVDTSVVRSSADVARWRATSQGFSLQKNSIALLVLSKYERRSGRQKTNGQPFASRTGEFLVCSVLVARRSRARELQRGERKGASRCRPGLDWRERAWWSRQCRCRRGNAEPKRFSWKWPESRVGRGPV